MICAIISFIILDLSNSSENMEEKQNQQTKYVDLLKIPSVLICCFLLISAQMSISWTMPSLQPFLKENFNKTNRITIASMFMVEGATYAIFSPVWGILFDRGWN